MPHPRKAKQIVQHSDQETSLWWDHFDERLENVYRVRSQLTEENYWSHLVGFVASNEGCVLHPYPDLTHWSIGYGLLLKRSDSNAFEKLAIAAFEFIGRSLPDFVQLDAFDNPASLRQYRLTPQECMGLLEFSLRYNHTLIKAKIPFFDLLAPNQRIAIQSLWYNCPALVGPNLIRYLNIFYETGQPSALLQCIYEIEQNSNSSSRYWFGIQGRRYREGAMFSNPYLDFILKVPVQRFDHFIYCISNDYPKLFSLFLAYLEEISYEDVMSLVLSESIDPALLPDIHYFYAIAKTKNREKSINKRHTS